jgi:hypothetical protein
VARRRRRAAHSLHHARAPLLIWGTRSSAATCCYSAERRPACPRRCTRPPTRGSSFRCGKDCARSMWRWPPPWRSVKRCGKPQRPPTARADASRQTSAGKGDYSSELESSRKNTKRVRDISRPWALPLTRIARWRSVASCRLSKSPHKRGGHRAPPTSPTPAAFPETMAKKSFAWNFPRPKQWQKKAWLKFSSTQNIARMSRA